MKELLAIVVSLLILGCNLPDSGPATLNPNTPKTITKGLTTKEQVVEMLGRPQNQTQDRMYGYIRTIHTDGHTTRYALTVYFDDLGVVRDTYFVEGNN